MTEATETIETIDSIETIEDDFLDDSDLAAEADEEAATLYEHRRVTADKGQSPMRVDKFLMEHLGDTSRNRIQKAAEAGMGRNWR